MIVMEEGLETRGAMMMNLQKEQERERRRIRDRQRRQSMSVEERERHLARRRRNYQLRRLRAESSRFHRHHQIATTASASLLANVNAALTSVGLEIPAHKLGKLSSRRLRLSHLKHVARSVDNDDADDIDVEVPNNHTIGAITNQNEIVNSACVSPKGGLRLNRVKCLARSLASDMEKATQKKEVHLELLSLSINVPKEVVDQPYLVTW